MANMNIRTPRFYVDYIQYLLSRGVAQNGEFDVTATGGSGASAFRGIQTGSEAELFDGRPLNLVSFDTSGDTDSQVLVTLDMQSANPKQSFVAILNHNLNSSNGKIRISAGSASSRVTAVDAGNANTSDVSWGSQNVTQIVNADSIVSASDNKSVAIKPDTDGSTIIIFDEQDLRYWGIQFEGTIDQTSTGTTDGTWGSTDFTVGQIMVGEYYDMPHSPDLNVKRSIMFDQVTLQQSIGGQRFSSIQQFGRRTLADDNKNPFLTHFNSFGAYGGRMSYDMKFSYINSSNLMPSKHDAFQHTEDTIIEDLWNKTNGRHIPFIFTQDKTSTEYSDYLFARFAQDNLQMTQVAPDVFDVSMRIEEEF
jgi:hypothetical protein